MYKPSQLKQLDSEILKMQYGPISTVNRFKYIKIHLAKGAKIYNDCFMKGLKKTKNTMDKKQMDKLKKTCKKKQLQYYKKFLNKGEY